MMSATTRIPTRNELAMHLLIAYSGEKLGREVWNMSTSESWRGNWLRVADEAMRLLRPGEGT